MPSSRNIRAGGAFVELSTTDRELLQGLQRAQRRLSNFGASLARISAGITAAGLASIAVFADSVRVFSQYGDRLDKLSGRTGVAVSTLTELEFAANRSGAEIQDLETAFRSLANFLQLAERGGKDATETLEELGLSVADLRRLSPDKQLELIAERLAEIEDPSRRSALAIDAFGRAGQKLLPLLSGGSDAISKYAEDARRLGLVIDGRAAAAAAKFTDRLGELLAQLRVLRFEIGASVAGPLTKYVELLQGGGSAVLEFVRENRTAVVVAGAVAGAVLGVGSAALIAGLSLQVAAFAIGGLVSTLAFLATGVAAVTGGLGGLPLLILLVGAAITATAVVAVAQSGIIAKSIDGVGFAFKLLGFAYKPVLGGIRDALAAGDIPAAAKLLGLAIKVELLRGISSLVTDYGSSMSEIVAITIRAGTKIAEIFAKVTTFSAGLWDRMTTEVAKLITDLIFLTDPESREQARAQLEADTVARAEERAGELERRLEELDKTRKAADAAGDAVVQGIASKAEKDLETAKNSLEDAIEEAKQSAEEASQAAAESGQRFGDAAGSQLNRISARGTFAERTGAVLASGDSGTNRIANAAEKILEFTRRIDRNSEQGAAFS